MAEVPSGAMPGWSPAFPGASVGLGCHEIVSERLPPISAGSQSERGNLRPTMLKHNSYFDGKVQSLGFERHGRRQTVGVILPGEYHFNTDAPERMSVIGGELTARLVGGNAWIVYAAGTSFEVPGKSAFEVKAAQPTAYLCEFI